jgi:hypothetical protein
VDKSISVGSKASPAPLINRLRWHPEQYQEYMVVKDEIDCKTAATSSQTPLTMSSFTLSLSSTEESFKKTFLQWIVEQNMPLTVGGSPAFVSMVKCINKTISTLDYKMMHDLLFSKKTEAMQKLKSYCESNFYLITCDYWTSLAQGNYGALTLHFIYDFELKTFIIGGRKHPNGASATELETQLNPDLTSWGLENNSSFLLLLTASNMRIALFLLKMSCNLVLFFHS